MIRPFTRPCVGVTTLKLTVAMLVLFLLSASFVISHHFFLISGEPGVIPHRDFPVEEVGQIISPQMGNRHMNQPSVFNGYAVLAGNAIHEVWDISDPYHPEFRAEMISQHAAGEAESHQVTYGRDSIGNYYLATTSGRGIDLWNVNDIQSPVYVKALELPGINYGDVANGVWGVSWQGDYLFVGATSNGIYVVDVRNILEAELVATVSVTDLGGVLAGPLFAIGNLLVVTTPKGNAGVATVDISRPTEPVVLDFEQLPPKSYIGGFYGKYAVLITPLRLIDVTSDPTDIQLLHTSAVPKSEYLSFSDGHLFLGGLRGGTQGVYKYDITNPLDPQIVGRVEGRDQRWDDQFSCPVGNLLLIADDQRVAGNYVGGVIGVHAEKKDTVGPNVLYSLPAEAATELSVDTKIGISFTDWIEFASVDETSFIVRPVGGEPLKGSWGCTYTTLTFTPGKPLTAQTDFELILPAGGITDLSGNPIAETITIAFSTGEEKIRIGQAQLIPGTPIPLGDSALFAIENPEVGIEYEWTTGDGAAMSGSTASYEYSAPGRYPVTLKAHQIIRPDSIFEAESAQLSGGVNIATTHVGFSGTGYVDYPGATGENVKVGWELREERDRVVDLQFFYANGGNINRPLHLLVNNGPAILVDFPSTGGWKTWQAITVSDIHLSAGLNSLELKATASSVGPNIDYFFLAPDPETAGRKELLGSQSFIQVVYAPHSSLPANSSGLMQMIDSTLWSLNPDANSISILDINTLEKLREIPVGKHPSALAEGPNQTVWVLNRDSWNITIHDIETGAQKEVVNLPYASQPNGMVFSRDGSVAYISLQAAGRLLKMNSLTKETEAVLELGPDHFGRIPELGALTLDTSKQQLLLTRFISTIEGGELYVIDAESLELEQTISLAYDSGVDTDQFSRGLPNYLTAISISPDGQSAWLPSKKDNIQRGGLLDGLALEHDNTVRSIVSVVDLETKEEIITKRLDFDNSDRCHSATFNQYGDLIFLTFPGNNQLAIVNAFSGKEITRLITENSPDACLFDPKTGKLFVHNYLSRSISVFDIRSLENSQEGVELLGHISMVEEEPLAADVLLGKQLFYQAGSRKLNAEGYMSCASCHLDGGQDGQTWDMSSLGEGFRNTIDLRGRAGTGQGRLHWSANFDEIHDFENQIRSLSAGTGLMTDDSFRQGTRSDPLGESKAGLSVELDALAAYLESLTAYPPSPYNRPGGNMTDEAWAGYSLFAELECHFCHAGNQYSNSNDGLRHDVGVLKTTSGQRRASNLLAIDVPGLRGLWSNAPYLHDGSASTIYDVLVTENDGGRHGMLQDLPEQRLNELVAFLQQLDGTSPPALPSPWQLELTSPPPGKVVEQGEAVLFALAHTLTEIEEVIYFANGVEVGRVDTAPFTISWVPQAGEYELEVKVIHGENRYGTVPLSNTIRVIRPLISTEQADYEVEVFPNPANGTLFINLFSWEEESIDISIIDMGGRAVHRQSVSGTTQEQIQLDVSFIPAGLYLIQMRGSEGVARVEKVIIQD